MIGYQTEVCLKYLSISQTVPIIVVGIFPTLWFCHVFAFNLSISGIIKYFSCIKCSLLFDGKAGKQIAEMVQTVRVLFSRACTNTCVYLSNTQKRR